MAWDKWADREDYAGLRAAPVRCPCCRKMKAADMIYKISHLTTEQKAVISEVFPNLSPLPDYICDGKLATLHRTGHGDGLPGSY